MFGSETAINIYDLVKSEIEYDDIMRCPKKTISQLFSSRTTYNLGTAYLWEYTGLNESLVNPLSSYDVEPPKPHD